MIPFLLFLIGTGLLVVAVVESAFILLMRLPQRLEAERESEGNALAAYLEDPPKFFVPARLIRGSLLTVAMVLMAELIGTAPGAWLGLLASGLGLSIVVAQIVPAIIVRRTRSPERVLELLLPLFTATANVLGPLSALIISFLGVADRPLRETAGTATSPTTTDLATTHAPTRADESRLLRSVVDFGETLVREVMTPRPDIVALPSTATIDDLRRLVQEQEYSRLPVYNENLDNIAGVIVVKDLIQRPDPPAGDRPVTEIMRAASFVPETKRVSDLLRDFQRSRSQLAIVVDEYGGTAGLVTVEDVVEELVGEIRDEYDLEAEPVMSDGDGGFVFSGKVAISELSERTGLDIEDGGFETVGGYVLTRVGRVPAVGERFIFDGLNIEVLEAERRRIHRVRVRKAPAVVAESAG